MDHLDEKSTSLLQSARNTSSLVAEVTKLHSSIAAADSTIGLLNDSIASNYSYLHRIDQLHERSFFLESSLSTNDFVTNQNTWSNLYAEYKHILNHIEGPVVDISTPQTINTEEVSRDKIDLAEVPRLLSKIISVSDMQLKPIRCREKKMYKKKSKYRLSHIYNINPLASSPILEVPNSEEEIDASSSFDTQEDDEVMIQIIDDSTVIQNDNDHNSNNNTISTTSDDNTNTHNRNQLTIATSPETSFAPYSFSSRMRSNSVPEITFTHGGLNIFNTEGIMQASNILTDFTKGETEDSMRLNRLKHFISIHGLSKKESEHLDEPMGDVSLADSDFTKTPNFTPIDLDHPDDIDILDIDACSDFSYYSPEKTEDIDDDFEKYLRKSRVDLQNAFPAIHRSTSHESVFSNHIEINIPKWKFHNPIDNTASTHSTGPTIKISDDYIHSYKGEFKDGQKTTTNLLSQMMKDTEPPEPIPIKPKKITASASASPVASSNTSASSDPLTPSKTGVSHYSIFLHLHFQQLHSQTLQR